MRLPPDRAVSILQLLLEGTSVYSVERVTGVHLEAAHRGGRSARRAGSGWRDRRLPILDRRKRAVRSLPGS